MKKNKAIELEDLMYVLEDTLVAILPDTSIRDHNNKRVHTKRDLQLSLNFFADSIVGAFGNTNLDFPELDMSEDEVIEYFLSALKIRIKEGC